MHSVSVDNELAIRKVGPLVVTKCMLSKCADRDSGTSL